ncbi:MAG: AMP-binding protein, partial [Mycobacterium sp.]
MTADTIVGLLDECANRPDRPLLRDCAGATLTVADVAALTAAGTRWLWDAGIRPGMTVAWQLPSHASAALLMLALARSSVTQAPVLHIYRQREVCAAIDVAQADILIVDDSTAANAPAGPTREQGRVRVVTLPTDFVEQLRALPVGLQPELARPHSADDPRWIYFTSGTT